MANRTSREEPAGEAFAVAVEGRPTGFLREVWAFLRANRKWWLTPIVVVIVFLGLLVALGGSGAAPFIYTLF